MPAKKAASRAAPCLRPANKKKFAPCLRMRARAPTLLSPLPWLCPPCACVPARGLPLSPLPCLPCARRHPCPLPWLCPPCACVPALGARLSPLPVPALRPQPPLPPAGLALAWRRETNFFLAQNSRMNRARIA